jgi:hypothetical protein
MDAAESLAFKQKAPDRCDKGLAAFDLEALDVASGETLARAGVTKTSAIPVNAGYPWI